MQLMHAPEVPQALTVLTPLTHVPPLQQKPPAQVPLPGWPHWLAHDPLKHVGALPRQPAQANPFEPQALLAVPAVHVPAEQQPPLQPVWLAPPHDVLHRCVTVLHELCAGQSAATLQPQLLAMHRWPCALAVQLLQVPELPHMVTAVPVTQLLPEQQKPPEQVPLPDPLH